MTPCVLRHLGVLSVLSGLGFAASSNEIANFHRDIEPILQRHCQGCHRPGEIGPMSLLTYKDVRPWAKAIRSAVVQKKMPPWLSDPRYGEFANDRSLDENKIRKLESWA